MTNEEKEKIIKSERNNYMKIWRSQNKDKVKNNNKNYWQKRALKNKNCK